MRGHIVKRYKGSYTIVLNLGKDPETGKPKQQWISVKGTKKNAEKRLAELLHDLDKGTFIKPEKVTVKEYLERWLKDNVLPNVAPRTAEGYEHIVRQHLIPGLGSIILAQLKPEHLQRYYAEKLEGGRRDGKGGLSARTVRHHHVTLHTALSIAVKMGLLMRNVADAVTPPRYQRHEFQTLTENEMHRALECAKDTPYYALLFLALFTGMRRSEILGLRWGDVDLLYSQISVVRSLHHLRNGQFVFRPPKTAKGRRTIALSPAAALVLNEHKKSQELIFRQTGDPLTDEDLVFCTSEGQPLLPDTITRAWMRMRDRLALHGVRLHDLRHSHATQMLKQNIHPKVVQERLGHASISLTLDTYSHVAPGLQKAAAEKFDEVMKTWDEAGTEKNIDRK
ncbi:MAG: tyrosine-type recombinase/integrase [Dehalococcoidia bacterium]